MGYIPRHTVQEMAEGRVYQSECLLSLPGPVCAHPQRWCRVGLSIAPAISTAVSTVPCAVSSRTWSDTWGSGSGTIVSSVAPDGDGSTTRQALALRLRWARAAPRCGVVDDWALGPEWDWCRHPPCPQSDETCKTPVPTR